MLKNEKESYPVKLIVQVAMFRIDFSYFLTPVDWFKGSFAIKIVLFDRKVALSAKKLQL